MEKSKRAPIIIAAPSDPPAEKAVEPTATACVNCAYAFKLGRVKLANGAVDMSIPQLMQCRRFPPQLLLTPNGPIPLWPQLAVDCYCGEFKPSAARVN